jgi:16S rRNA (cytosine967-C5)-methyltransferase
LLVFEIETQTEDSPLRLSFFPVCHINVLVGNLLIVLGNEENLIAGCLDHIADRLGLNSIRTQAGDIRHVVENAGTFDRILLDAPCSGLGVIRRKPDLKWNKVPGDISEIAGIQRDLLNIVSQAVRPGGVLVYSTCTIMPEENIELVREFLAEHPEFEGEAIAPYLPATARPEDTDAFFVQMMPQQFDSDGFFIARLRRKS